MLIFKGIAASKRHVAESLVAPLARQFSSVAKMVDIVHNDKTGIATLSMNRQPANGLNLELLTELTYSFRELEKSKCRGIVLTSSQPKIFSAGLDLWEMYKRDRKHVRTFWRAVQELWSTVYGTELPTAAAINGACPAAGCVIALSCDYRVFVEGKHRIGLNEAVLGLVPPKWTLDMVMNTIGYRQTEISLMRGSMFIPEDALRIGLVDELASDKGDAIAKCENYLASCAKVPFETSATIRRQLREKVLKWLKENQDLDAEIFINRLEQPEVQQALGDYLKANKKNLNPKTEYSRTSNPGK